VPAQDFVPVAGFANFVNAFALSSGTPAKTMAEFGNWVRTQGQGKGVVGVPAPAATPEFMVKVLGERSRIDRVSAPYRGSAPMIGDMLGTRSAAVARGVAMPDVRDRLTALGLTVEAMTAAQLGARERACAKGWVEIIKRSGFVPQ